MKGKHIYAHPGGRHIFGTVKVGAKGQIVIPKAARDHFDLHAGQRLILASEDGEGFVLIPAEIFEQKLEYMNRLCFSANE